MIGKSKEQQVRNEIDVWLERLNNRERKLDWLQSLIAVIVILGIFYMITKPKVEVHTVVEEKIEYIDRIVEVEVEKVVEVPIIQETRIYEYLDIDGIDDFDTIFKMYRNELGPNKLFLWRNSLYTTNWKEEKYEKNND